MPYGVIKPQWVKSAFRESKHLHIFHDQYHESTAGNNAARTSGDMKELPYTIQLPALEWATC